MGISVNGPVAGNIRPGGIGYFNPNDPEQVKALADDATFMRSIEAVLTESLRAGGGSTDHNATLNALLNGDISALTTQERAEILDSAQQSASMIRNGRYGKLGFTGHETTDLIAKYMNNQGYTGPGANQVLLTVPVAGGGTANITRAQVLDDEGFGALVDKVVGDASGKPITKYLGGMPLSGRDQFSSMSKWSETERIAYLQKAADLAKDGNLSLEDEGALAVLAQQNTAAGGDEPSVKLSNGQVVSKDDIMEDQTFKQLLLGKDANGRQTFNSNTFLAAQPALRDLINSADYRQLSYAERVDLLNRVSSWKYDGNTVAAKATEIAGVMKSYLVPGPSLEVSVTGNTVSITVNEVEPGRTLANGTTVTTSELSSSTGFDGLIQRTLRSSGVSLVTNPNSGGDNRYTILGLLTMDTSKLDTPAKRFEVLDMISRAASDKTISQAELRNIEKTVDRLSNRPSIWV